MDTTRHQETGIQVDPKSGTLPVLPVTAADAIMRDPSDGILKRWDAGTLTWVPVLAGDFSFPGQAQGDVLYFNGTVWTILPAGEDGQVFQSRGPGANPRWVDGPLSFQGTWNAFNNTPALASGVGGPGDVYIVSMAGTTNLDGFNDWEVGDWAVFNGTADQWEKIDNSEPAGAPGRFVQRSGGAVFTTSATGYQVVTSMTITPGTGDYDTVVTGEFSCDTSGNQVRLAIFSGGSNIAEFDSIVCETAGEFYPFALNARVNVPGAGNAITLRLARATGGPPYDVSVRDAQMQVIDVVAV